MKKTKHPVQLPDSLITKWLEDTDTPLSVQFQEAAEWGANAELEECCMWMRNQHLVTFNDRIPSLRADRRPKPPSLKAQAQSELDRLIALIPSEGALAMAEPIRRALETLPE